MENTWNEKEIGLPSQHSVEATVCLVRRHALANNETDKAAVGQRLDCLHYSPLEAMDVLKIQVHDDAADIESRRNRLQRAVVALQQQQPAVGAYTMMDQPTAKMHYRLVDHVFVCQGRQQYRTSEPIRDGAAVRTADSGTDETWQSFSLLRSISAREKKGNQQKVKECNARGVHDVELNDARSQSPCDYYVSCCT